jgi:hypothetical protein
MRDKGISALIYLSAIPRHPEIKEPLAIKILKSLSAD